MCVCSNKPSHHPRTSLQSLSDCSVQKWWRLERVGIVEEQLRKPVSSGHQTLPKAHVRLSPAATTTRKAQETLDSSASVDIERCLHVLAQNHVVFARTLSDYRASNAVADGSAYTFPLCTQIGVIRYGLNALECPMIGMRFFAIFSVRSVAWNAPPDMTS